MYKIIVGTAKVQGIERSSYLENLTLTENWSTNKMITNRFTPHWTSDKKRAVKFFNSEEASAMADFITRTFGDKTEVFNNNWRVNINGDIHIQQS